MEAEARRKFPLGRVMPNQLAAIEYAEIIATRARGCTLATRNVKDFACTGVLVVNPWET